VSKILSFITFTVLTLGLTSHARDQVLSIITPVLVGNIETLQSKDDSELQDNDSTWFDDLVFSAKGENLVTNPGFETGDTTGWWGPGLNIVPSGRTGNAHGGKFSVLTSNRTANWERPRQSLVGVLENGKAYQISGWVRLQNAEHSSIGITILQEDSSGSNWYKPPGCWSTGYIDQWIHLSGIFTLNINGTIKDLAIYFEGPPAGVDFYVDDVEVVELADWRTGANQWIDRARKRNACITVLSTKEQPEIYTDLHIRQVRHTFGFGSEINDTEDRNYLDFFKNHFEWAVVGWQSKWPHTEPQQGYITYDKPDKIYDFCRANEIKVRGHCLFWAVAENQPAWVRDLTYAPLPALSELRTAVENRMNSAVNHFKGKYLHWDINNEMLRESFYADRLGESIRVWMFQEANRIDPNCILFVNETGVIANGWFVEDCKNLINHLIDNGAPVHALGVQCHINRDFDRLGVISRFNSLAELGLPIWVTEFTVHQADDMMRANDMEDFYRIAISCPAVGGIMMWGFSESGPPGGSADEHGWWIVNADWTLNEAGRRYESLIKEWTTELSAVTDENGQTSFRGFCGTYKIRLTRPDGASFAKTIELVPGTDIAQFTFMLKSPSEEGFETGDFNNFDWMSFGDADWIISTKAYSGTYCAQAGSIGNNETSTLSATLDCIEGDITFYCKVSSERNFDYLKFYIDGAEHGKWSGDQGWIEVSFPVEAGTRTFEWTYPKDSSASRGEDTAWIDDIVFPVD